MLPASCCPPSILSDSNNQTRWQKPNPRQAANWLVQPLSPPVIYWLHSLIYPVSLFSQVSPPLGVWSQCPVSGDLLLQWGICYWLQMAWTCRWCVITQWRGLALQSDVNQDTSFLTEDWGVTCREYARVWSLYRTCVIIIQIFSPAPSSQLAESINIFYVLLHAMGQPAISRPIIKAKLSPFRWNFALEKQLMQDRISGRWTKTVERERHYAAMYANSSSGESVILMTERSLWSWYSPVAL